LASSLRPSLRLAVDLGAGSGRAVLGRLAGDVVELDEVHRFHYAPRPVAGHLRWDMARLFDGLRESVVRAVEATAGVGGRLASLGVDSWAVDYGFVDVEGRLLEEPVCYRDPRTEGVMDEVFALVPREEIFARTGIQFLSLNTLYQLFAHVRAGLPARAARLLLIPDLCHQFLCGSTVSERTNASTTQLLDPASGDWDAVLFDRLGLPRALMPPIVAAGSELGDLRPAFGPTARAETPRVVAPATHDTASAVAGTPLEPGWAYVSSGTWSLVGLERDTPLGGADAARANVTNEAGAYGSVRTLKNVMGLWILESCQREWEAAGRVQDPGELLGAVAASPAFPGFVFPDDPRFFHPRGMTAALGGFLRETGQIVPDDPALLAKVVLDSLALRYASVLDTLECLGGQVVPGLHIVGGGSRNDYLNQATADATGRPVLAGPAEAAAAGNVLVQAVACGEIASLAEGRARLARGAGLRRFEPRRAAAWAEATSRYREIEARYGGS
jgi:rhamnulokinase